jgi:hypothetical protein
MAEARHTRDQSSLVNYTHIFSPETRFQFAPRKLSQYDNDPFGPRVTISGVANFGRDVNFPVLLDESHYEWQEVLSYSRARHFFKFGADVEYVRAHTSFPVSFGGAFSFASLAEFVSGKVNTFSQGFGNPDIHLPRIRSNSHRV